jgi:predicted AlkP superfamily phosphohydrolase/phosphomutase
LVVLQLGCGHPGGPAKGQGPRIVILGLDGADWQLIDPLIAKGRLPLFKELKEKYAWGYLRTSTPAKSPVIWTSIATGKTSAKHGIDDFRAKKPNAQGRFAIFNSMDIRQPLLWDMLGDNGRRSVLVNWYLSYPPMPLNGVNVSDYFRSSAISTRSRERSHLSQTVYPPERSAELAKLLIPDYRQALKRMNLPDFPEVYRRMQTGMEYLDLPIFRNYPEWVIEENLVGDVADHLFGSEDFDLFAAYYKMTDVVQHFAYMALVDEAYKKTLDQAAVQGVLPETLQAEAYARLADILCPVYQNLEKVLRRYFDAAAGRETYFIILSDHGFSFFHREGTVRYNHVGPGKAPNGIIIVRGPKVKPGKITMARIYDIAPTVLYLLGLPLDRSMDGKPLYKLFTFRHASSYTTYKRKKIKPFKRNSELDEKALKELKALGYIN